MAEESQTSGPLAQLAGSTVRYFVIGAIGRGIQLLTVPILLRLLTAAEYGVQAVALLNEQLLMIIGGYVFANALSKHYTDARRATGDVGPVVGTAIAGALVSGAAAFLVWEALAPVIASLTLPDAGAGLAVTRLVGVSALANLVVTLTTSVWQLERRFAAYGIATIGQYGLAALLGIGLVAGADLGPEGVVIGWTVASVVVALVSLVVIRGQHRLAVDRSLVRSFVAYGAPLVPAALVMLVLSTNDRYLLASLDGLGAVGVYAAVLTVVNAFNTGLVAPFKRGLFPMMWQLRGEPGEVDFHRRTFTLYWLGQTWLLVGLAAFGDVIMSLMSGGDHRFVDRAPALAIVYGGFVLLNAYELLSAGYFFEGRTHHYLVTVTVCTVLAVLWNVALIPTWDVWAAATSNPVSYGVFALMSWWFGRRYFAVPYEWGRVAGMLVAGSGAVAAIAALRGTLGFIGDAVAVLLVLAFPVLLAFGGVLSADERDAVRRSLGRLRRAPSRAAAGS
jgi:O-antigen/teichoic acid export membrane protein